MSHIYRVSIALGFAASIATCATAWAIDPAQPDEAATQDQQAVAMVSQGVAAKAAGDASCPKVIVAPDLGAFPKRDDDYGARLEALARDCANLGAETILKVAVVGEGEREAKGPSWFNAPLAVAIKDAEGKVVETRKIRVKVEIPTGLQTVAFRHLEENVSLPPVDGGYAGWLVEVGFDPSVPEMTAPPPTRKVSKTRSTRRYAVRNASRAARRQARPAVVAAPQPPVAQAPQQPVAAPKPAAPESPWKRLADSFSERRDNAARTAQQEAAARQSAAVAQRQGGRPVAQAQQPAQAQQRQPRPVQAQQRRRPAGDPQAAAPVPQPSFRAAASR